MSSNGTSSQPATTGVKPSCQMSGRPDSDKAP
jgi:hypothetical protein